MGRVPLSGKSRGRRLPRAVVNRVLHCVARYVPMWPGWRVRLHRWRGVEIGRGVFIGTEVFIDDAEPDLVAIEDDVTIIARASIIAHAYYPAHLAGRLAEAGRRRGVRICRGAYVGFGAIILPGVTVGAEAVVGAGTVVSRDVPPRTVVVGAGGQVVRRLDRPPGDCGLRIPDCGLAAEPSEEGIRDRKPEVSSGPPAEEKA